MNAGKMSRVGGFLFWNKVTQTLYLQSLKGGLAQLARAFAWHAKGHRFDSGNLHKKVRTSGLFLFLDELISN